MKRIVITLGKEEFLRLNSYAVEFLGLSLADLAQVQFNRLCKRCESQISYIDKELPGSDHWEDRAEIGNGSIMRHNGAWPITYIRKKEDRIYWKIQIASKNNKGF